MSEVVPTICRLCIAHCGVLATVEDDNGRRKVAFYVGTPHAGTPRMGNIPVAITPCQGGVARGVTG